eukprot:11155712-Lingulodinium_polyedra.AAC.1
MSAWAGGRSTIMASSTGLATMRFARSSPNAPAARESGLPHASDRKPASTGQAIDRGVPVPLSGPRPSGWL